MSEHITERQMQALAVIIKLSKEKDVPPTLREVGRTMGLSQHAILLHAQALRRKAYIEWEPLLARTIRVLRVPPNLPEYVGISVVSELHSGVLDGRHPAAIDDRSLDRRLLQACRERRHCVWWPK
jgi:SOS-response transcriptional repressor LexA